MKGIWMPPVTVVAAALVLQAGATFVAPRFAPAPPEVGSNASGAGLLRSGPGLSIPGLASALGTSPSPSSSLAPTQTERRSPTRVLAAASDGDPDPDPQPQPESSPIATPDDPIGARLRAFVGVSSKRVPPGGNLRYVYVAKNTGERTFRGNLTLTTHAPAGTFRCSSDLGGACVVPGDYSGGSKQPNDSHVNPEAVTKHVTIRPGEKQVLFRMRVQVSQAAADGLELHNHAHVDGEGNKPPTTIDAPVVRVRSGG
jgi:hypothetical protein